MTAAVDKHGTILLSAAPAGRFLEGILDDATSLKPGHCMAIKAATEPVGGRLTWTSYAGTQGHRTLIAILLENELVGLTCEDAIADGQRIRMYCPIAGDELLVRVSATGTGSGGALAIGDKLILSASGEFIPNVGSPESEPFVVMETVAEVLDSDSTLVHVMFTGY